MANNAHTGELIEVDDLQRAVLEVVAQGTGWAEIARRMGWTFVRRRRGSAIEVGDGTRVKRAIGYAPYHGGRTRRHYTNRRVGILLAEQIAEAAQLDPVDVGC